MTRTQTGHDTCRVTADSARHVTGSNQLVEWPGCLRFFQRASEVDLLLPPPSTNRCNFENIPVNSQLILRYSVPLPISPDFCLSSQPSSSFRLNPLCLRWPRRLYNSIQTCTILLSLLIHKYVQHAARYHAGRAQQQTPRPRLHPQP